MSGYRLSVRQQEVYEYIEQGLSDKQIAEKMSITHQGVSHHTVRIYKKTGLSRKEIISQNPKCINLEEIIKKYSNVNIRITIDCDFNFLKEIPFHKMKEIGFRIEVEKQ